jgi:hypothetical protein
MAETEVEIQSRNPDVPLFLLYEVAPATNLHFTDLPRNKIRHSRATVRTLATMINAELISSGCAYRPVRPLDNARCGIAGDGAGVVATAEPGEDKQTEDLLAKWAGFEAQDSGGKVSFDCVGDEIVRVLVVAAWEDWQKVRKWKTDGGGVVQHVRRSMTP